MQNESSTGERDDTALDADFALFQRRGDAAALARVFDRAAPRLLLLAAHFARDAAEAEDLVQTTFLHAVRDAASWESGRPVAAWLAGILRHRALDLLRARRRRPESELDGAPLAANTAGPAALAEQHDLFERVVAATQRIEEPFRTVLLMRLVHGLEPTAIAHTLGRAPGTVRMQLKRGLDKLRAALPSAEVLLGGAFAAVVIGEGARGLAAVREQVLAAARGTPTATVVGGGLMASIGAKVAALALVAGVLLVAVLSLRSNTPSASPNETPLARVNLEAAASTVAPTHTSALVSPPIEARREALTGPDAELAAEQVTDHTYSGRIVTSKGLAVANVDVRLLGANGKAQTTTAADGSFVLTHAFAPAADDELRIGASGRVPHRCPIAPVAGALTTDLGDIALPPSGRIVGRLVDSSGAPIIAAVPFDYEIGITRDSVETAGDTGIFVLDGVVEGQALHLETRHALYDVARTTIAAHDGVTTDVLLVHRGPSPLTRIAVTARPPNGGEAACAQEQHVRLVAADGTVLHASGEPFRRSDPRRETFVFGADSAVEYELVVDDPRFERVTSTGLRCGSHTHVDLVGAARVVFDVRESAAGDPLEEVTARVHCAADWRTPWSKLALERGASGWTSAALPATTLRVELSAPGRRTVEIEIAPELTRGELRSITLELPPVGRITGRVVDSRGTPRAGVELVAQSCPPARVLADAANDPTALGFWFNRAERRTAVSNDAGEFVFDGLVRELWDVTALIGGRPSAAIKRVALDGEPIEIVLADAAALEGRLLLSDGSWPEGLGVRAERVLPEGAPREPRRPELVCEVDEQGRFAFAALEVGPTELVLEARTLILSGSGQPLEYWGRIASLGQVDVQADATAVFEFDAAELAPIVAVVHVTRDGRPAPELLVVAHASSDPLAVHVLDTPRTRTNSDGRAVLVLFGAGPWCFRVCDVTNSFGHAVAGEHTPDAQRRIDVATDFATSFGRLTVVDPSGAPIADTPLIFYDANGVPNWHTTDGSGVVVATLALGRYEVGAVSRADRVDGRVVVEVASRVAIEWTAEGPQPPRVDLLRSPP